MQKSYRFNRKARASLLDELFAAGFTPQTVSLMMEPDDSACHVICDEADYERAVQVVSKHDPVAYDAAATQARTQRLQARQAILAYPTLSAPTNAQTVAAVKALCLAVAALYRED